MTHQLQPTKTSCGVACAAMLRGVPVRDVMEEIDDVRRGARIGARGYSVNLAEIGRLFGDTFQIGRQIQGYPTRDIAVALLRIRRPRRRNWHWALWRDGIVYDPVDSARTLASYEGRHVSYYEVTAR